MMMMMSSSSTLALMLLASLAVASSAASKNSVYSFRGGKSSPDGMQHGTRGLKCFREYLGEEALLEHVKVEESFTDEQLSVAIFMAYGKEGIDRACALNEEHKKGRALRENKQQQEASSSTQNKERKTQICTSDPINAPYPGNNTMSTYSDYAKLQGVDIFLPDGAPYTSRVDPKKLIQQVQVVLDDSLEAEYSGMLCESYFGSVIDLLSIPDLVFIKQGAILDGINSLTCGLSQGLSRSIQNQMQIKIRDSMKHDGLIDQAEVRATYLNSATFTEDMCTLSSELAALYEEIEAVKDKMARRT